MNEYFGPVFGRLVTYALLAQLGGSGFVCSIYEARRPGRTHPRQSIHGRGALSSPTEKSHPDG